eukprot:TRINITY_DN13242_c0_g3_i1.p1 TRINITY_DN13242_c0_g3~~TRINITY_DN13242_c0_g3_i1.p1  ORF type:complete len:649 (+),score=198.56 TRINITY_DN13242_c0_g3_i1:68-1948(+)
MYELHAAGDVAGEKKNYVMEFPYPPSFPELVARCESVFSMVRGSPFVTTHMEMYNERDATWQNVTSIEDTCEGCQLYVFEAESWVTDVQQQIPPPVHPPVYKKPDLPPRVEPILPMFSKVEPVLVHGSSLPSITPSSPGLSAQTYTRMEPSPVPRPIASSPTLISPADPAPVPIPVAIPAVPLPTSFPSSPAAAPLPSVPLPGPNPVPVRPIIPTHIHSRMALHHTDVTHDEKTIYVYEHLINHYSGTLTLDDWEAVCTQLGLPLSTVTLRDLFRRADSNGNTMLSRGEWGKMAERYPALLESMYFRVRDNEESANFDTRLNEAKIQLSVSMTSEQAAAQNVMNAARVTAERTAKLTRSEQLVDEAVAGHAAAVAALEAHRQNMHEMTETQAECELQMRRCVDSHNEVVVVVNKEVDECDETAKRHDMQKENVAYALNQQTISEERFAAIQSEMNEGKTQTHITNTEAGRWQTESIETERLMQEAARDVSREAESFTRLEMVTAELTAAEQEAMAGLTRLAEVRAQAEQQYEVEMQLYNESVGNMAEVEKAINAFGNQLMIQTQSLASLESENATYTQRRKLVEDQERPLVEEELELRARRHQLEQRDYTILAHQQEIHERSKKYY